MSLETDVKTFTNLTKDEFGYIKLYLLECFMVSGALVPGNGNPYVIIGIFFQ